MTVFAEFIYETGSHSVGQFENEAEVLEAAKAQHGRATGSEEGGPTGHPAERIVKIELYDMHPGDLAEPSEEVLAEELANLSTEGGAMATAERVKDLASPLLSEVEPQGSIFKMESTKTLTEGWE